ncbi:MAG: hypothetical protein AAGU27_21990 [Dehalobacterium sp.]
MESYHSGTKSILSRDDFRKYLLDIINIDGKNRFEKVDAFQNGPVLHLCEGTGIFADIAVLLYDSLKIERIKG